MAGGPFKIYLTFGVKGASINFPEINHNFYNALTVNMAC